MPVMELKIVDRCGNTKAAERGGDAVSLVYTAEYEEGDRIVLESSEKDIHIRLQLDDALGPAMCFLKTDVLSYTIPFGEKKTSYSPKAFAGDKHYLYVRPAGETELSGCRNLAVNVYDQHEDTGCYPHAHANTETRGEAVFAARNAIDGVCENRSHGNWPYESWGINRRDDAELTVEFGREVEIDRIVLYTRADFPHDNWWKQVTLSFSDGTNVDWQMEKSVLPHELRIEKKRTEWVRLSRLIKSEDPSPFPALSQIEVYGTETFTTT